MALDILSLSFQRASGAASGNNVVKRVLQDFGTGYVRYGVERSVLLISGDLVELYEIVESVACHL